MSNNKEQRRSQLKLILLLLVFLLPVIAAYVMYKNPQWQPAKTKNYGVLYKPAVSINKFTLRTQDDKAFTLDNLRGKWSLIYIGTGSCDKPCEETLIKARDARWAQGTEATRINYYYLLTVDNFTGDVAKLLKAYPGLIMLHGNAEQRNELIRQFRTNNTVQPGSDNRLYLVDPIGNIVMHYPYGFRHIGLMEDLKYLLKWSQIG